MTLKTIILILACMFSCNTFAKTTNDKLLSQLDKELDSSKVYVQKKENELRRLKDNLKLAITPTDRFLTYEQIAIAYSHYSSDSALVYYQYCLDLGKKVNNKVWLEKAVIGQSLVLANRGDNFVSMRKLHSLGSLEEVDTLLKASYVQALMANYVRSTTGISKEFNYHSASEIWKQYSHYIPQNNIGYITCKMIADKNYDSSKIIAEIKHILEKAPNPSYESRDCHMQLLIAYLKVGDRKSALHEAVLAEIENLKLCDRSSPALTRLVEMLDTKNSSGKDLRRIIRYLEVCMDDINGFRDVGRGIHVVELQNGILKRYQQQTAKDKDVTMTIILLLALVITIMLWLIRRQKQTSKELENKCNKLSADLSSMEKKVADAEKVGANGSKLLKEEEKRTALLGSIMARQYRLLGMALTDVRQHKKEIANLITSGQNQRAVKMAKGSVLRDHTVEEYYNSFDHDFLSVYPDFVEKTNAGMRTDSQLKPEKDGALSPELRICALMSLGVNDPKNIAEILQYSVQTVYNYGMKIRKGKIGN